MNLRFFLRLYISSALLGSCAFWAVACSSMLLDTRTSFSTEPQVKQSSHNISPVKSGIASFESEVGPSLAAVNLPRSRGVRHDPARNTPFFHVGSLLRDEPGSFQTLSARSAVLQADSGRRCPMTSGQDDRAKPQATFLSTNRIIEGRAIRSGGVVTGWRDSHLQTFRGGAAWKDTQRLALAGTRSPEPALVIVGIKPDRHLEAFELLPLTRRAAKSESADLSQTRTATTHGGNVGTVRSFPDRRLMTVSFQPSALVGAGASAPWHPHYLAAQHLCGVPVRTIAAVVKAESGGDPWALSPSGARGLMQVLPSTAAELGDFDLWDPAQNLIAGSCILRGHLDRRGGDLKAALADYHGGAWRTSTGPATRAYVEDVMGSAQ